MKKERYKNYFSVPHLFEEEYSEGYTMHEKYFYIMLRKLANRFKKPGGWFFHKDEKFDSKKKTYGFKKYGLSKRTCINARKKLKKDGLINFRSTFNKAGNKIGTEYKLTDKKLLDYHVSK